METREDFLRFYLNGDQELCIVRTGFFVAYDISDNKTRTKVFETLKDFGLKNVQESVFWGLLRVADREAVRRLLLESCQDLNDRAIMWPVTMGDVARAVVVNYPLDTFEVKEHYVC